MLWSEALNHNARMSGLTWNEIYEFYWNRVNHNDRVINYAIKHRDYSRDRSAAILDRLLDITHQTMLLRKHDKPKVNRSIYTVIGRSKCPLELKKLLVRNVQTHLQQVLSDDFLERRESSIALLRISIKLRNMWAVGICSMLCIQVIFGNEHEIFHEYICKLNRDMFRISQAISPKYEILTMSKTGSQSYLVSLRSKENASVCEITLEHGVRDWLHRFVPF